MIKKNLKINASSEVDDAKQKALAARTEARKLQALPYEQRQTILNGVANALLSNSEKILQANKLDLGNAEQNSISLQLLKRLKLTKEKIETLSDGIRSIANQKDSLGVVKSKRELASGLELTQVSLNF